MGFDKFGWEKSDVVVHKKSEDFNPYHEPAGSAEGGQFSSGGSEGGGGSESAGSSDDTPGFRVAQGLTPKEVDAVAAYSDYTFVGINDSLRGKASGLVVGGGGDRLNPAETKAAVHAIDSAIAKSTTSQEQVVYRGMTMNMRTRIKDVKKGDVVWDKAFISTTKDPNVTKRFANSDHQARIILPKGSHALDVGFSDSNRTADEGEKEVLLPRGSKFKVEALKPLTLRLVQ